MDSVFIYILPINFTPFHSVPLSIRPLDMTSAMATPDYIVGTVIIADPMTTNLVVTAVVASDPCPSVQWSFAGNDINEGAFYSIFDPCRDSSATSPYTFTLTFARLTADFSGEYSAVFTRLQSSVTLPPLIVTVPGT